ncbi:MAG TPA: hypothetical protein VJS64_01140 [Pyrinomonadaceae bacterium]|nr:hypothetical protein [Pyrinomonadaceae bacterium]
MLEWAIKAGVAATLFTVGSEARSVVTRKALTNVSGETGFANTSVAPHFIALTTRSIVPGLVTANVVRLGCCCWQKDKSSNPDIPGSVTSVTRMLKVVWVSSAIAASADVTHSV